jgi:hypothetical protein
MKAFILSLCIPCSLFCGEVNESKFHYLIDREIAGVDDALILLKDSKESSDIYTIYWLEGIKWGLESAKYTFNDCCEPHSGCDHE